MLNNLILAVVLGGVLFFGLRVGAEEKPKVEGGTAAAFGFPGRDAVKYPQDTPENALASIVKSMGSDDFGYFIAWLVTPDSTQRTLDKFKTLAAAVEDQKTNPAKIGGRKALLETIDKIQKDPNKKAHQATDKDEIARFMIDDISFIQFEKQKDGRWCLNPKARAVK